MLLFFIETLMNVDQIYFCLLDLKLGLIATATYIRYNIGH